MTQDRPSGAELLETAAHSLREEVLPAVPPEHRLTLLMALNAMGIAERELRDPDAPGESQSAALQGLLTALRRTHPAKQIDTARTD